MCPTARTSVTFDTASWIINAGAAIMLMPRFAFSQIAVPRATKRSPNNQLNSADFLIRGFTIFFCIVG